jgi:integrase
LVDRPPTPNTPAKPRYLRDVFNRWKAPLMPPEGGRIPDNVKKKEAALKLYEAQTGNPPLAELTRDMGEAFKTFLMKEEGASKTKNMRLGAVKELLNYAYRDLEWLARNPWHGLDIPYVTENRRGPWTLAQVKAFFGLPLFTKYELPNTTASNGGPAAYWIPLLGLYTGATVGELAQLRTADVVNRDGIACISITDEDEGDSDKAEQRTLKTEQRRREVPLHSELLRLGFLEYVAAMQKVGEEWLWPALSFRDGKPGGYFSAWFGRLRKTAPENVPDFHSFRHTVRSKLAAERVPVPEQDRITGHKAKGSAGVRVYTHYTLETLQEDVEKISYPGLVLPKVYKAD